MELNGQSVNRVYSIKEKTGEDFFYEWWKATSIYSAEILNIQFCKYSLLSMGAENFDSLRESFLRIYDIQTPYLYKPFDMGTYENTFFLTLPRIESTTLQTLIDSAVVFPFEIALKISINMLRGLSILERKKLHHNLLTPHNVWLTETEHDITNIKISGFLDFHILNGLGVQRPVYEKQNRRYFYTNSGTAGALESKAENDIFSVGVILTEMLTGEVFNTFETSNFPSGLPKWINHLIEKMVKDPESFESVQSLLDLFIAKAPEHSILEDAIEERIGEHGKAFAGTGEDAIPLEELPAVSTKKIVNRKKTTSAANPVKKFVLFIASFFKRKKQNGTMDPETTANKEEIERSSGVHPEGDGIGMEKVELHPQKEEFQPGFSDREVHSTDAVRWEVDKDRYMERMAEPSFIPEYHNKSSEKDKKEPLLSFDERDKKATVKPTSLPHDYSPLPEDKINSPEKDKIDSVDEKIKMMNKHREKSDVKKISAKLQGSSVNVSKVKHLPVSDEEITSGNDILMEADHGTVKEVNKRRIPNNSIISENKQKDTNNGVTSVSETSPDKDTFFQLFLKWIKELFTGK